MMGKGILIIVLGVSTIIMGIVLDISNNTIQGTEASVSFFERTQARLIANSAVEIYLEKMRRDKTLNGHFKNNTLLGGSYDIHIFGPDTALTIRSTSRFRGFTHVSLAKAKRSPIEIPGISSSILVSSEDLALNLNGNLDINGNDHNMDGTPGPEPAIPGIAVNDATDSAFVVNELKPKISKSILGSGGTPSVSTSGSSVDWRAVAENYIFAADATYPTGNYSTGTILGTAANPQITYVTGNVSFAGNASGYGVLVINGNLSMSGNFTFRGLIIAYGESTIDCKVTGNGGIFGATILVGESVDLQATGNASFYYSSQALNLAKNNLKSSRFEITDWWE